MKNTMPQVELKDETVRLPSSVRKAMNLHEGDTLDMNVEEGRIVLVPHAVPVTETDENEGIPSDLLAMIGANKGNSRSRTREEIDGDIREMRDEWD